MLYLSSYNQYWAFSLGIIFAVVGLICFGIIFILDRFTPITKKDKNVQHITNSEALSALMFFIVIVMIGGAISARSLFRDYEKEIHEAKLYYNYGYHADGTLQKAKVKIIKDIFDYDFEGRLYVYFESAETNYKKYLINLYREYLEKGLSKHDAYKVVYIENNNQYEKYAKYVNKKIDDNLNLNFSNITEEYKADNKK